jgi:hypothetical protein
MKQMTLEQFEDFVDRVDAWAVEQYMEIVDTGERPEDYWNKEENTFTTRSISHSWGRASRTLSRDGVTIAFNEDFTFDTYDWDSFETHDDMGETWTITGVTVIDENGDPLGTDELVDCLPGEFNTIDYDKWVFGFNTTEDIDYDEDSNMEEFTVQRDNEPDLRFKGESIGYAQSNDDSAYGNYSGETGRWTELTLYKTIGGKYICEQVGRTRWQGERDRYSAAVCETLDDVFEFFGHRWLAKILYKRAELEASQFID